VSIQQAKLVAIAYVLRQGGDGIVKMEYAYTRFLRALCAAWMEALLAIDR
jgi:hypothetical protein